MIFKRFFKPKWQHPDAAVRQQAILELNRDDNADKSVLHELAFNDGAEAVRKAALVKLNDFSLWWQASKHDNAERLQQLAEQALISQLLQNEVEPKLKQQFIAQCNRSSILEQLALTETDATLKFSLLQRLNKQELNLKALLDPVLSATQKLKLLEQIDDEKTLEKLARSVDGELLTAIQHKIEQQQVLKHKPQQLRKQITLLLAKFNAVRDRLSLDAIAPALEEYQAQWQALQADLPCLGAEAEEFQAKFDKILQQVTQWLEPKLAELAQKQQQLQAEQAQMQYQAVLQQQIDAIATQLQVKLQQADISAAQTLDNGLVQLITEIEQSTLNRKTELLRQIDKLRQQLQQLPMLAEQLAQLTRIIADWAALALPTDMTSYQQSKPLVTQLQQNWRAVVKQIAMAIPADLKHAQQALAQQWQGFDKQFQAETDKVQRQCRSKLAQFRRLYSAGKFKVLFGLFKGIEADYQQLSDAQQQALAKDFDFAKDKMAEVADWQEYIATPRKQALLEQIQALPVDVAENAIHQRANEVKQARAQWNSLGKADPALDDELNRSFDLACEQAFAPCREYFAAQDAIRQENVKQRQQLITQIEQYQVEATDSKTLEQSLQQFKASWQKAGAVDKEQFADLNQKFTEVLSPIRQRLEQLQQQAVDTKQQLIDKARAALALEDANLTAKVLKECQQQWKVAGNAARKHDQQMWQEFRAVCDGFFNARAEQFAQQKQAEQNELDSVRAQLADIEQALSQSADLTACNQLKAQLQTIAAHSQAATQAVRQLERAIEQKIKQLTVLVEQQQLESLFQQLTNMDLTAEHLPAEYRDVFAKGHSEPLSRQQLTLALEIVCEKPSPPADQAQRQQVQLMLLSDKHNAGQLLDKQSLFKRWLSLGAVEAEEQALLSRVKVLFI